MRLEDYKKLGDKVNISKTNKPIYRYALELTEEEARTLLLVLWDAREEYHEAIPSYDRHKGHAQGREECLNALADCEELEKRILKLFPELKP